MDNIEKDTAKKCIAILGGTGKEGKGLAYQWARAGYSIIIGSRQADKANTAVLELTEMPGFSGSIKGMTNEEAAREAQILVLTVPFSAHQAMLESVKPYATGKVFIDVTVPLVPPKVTKVQMPPAGSAAQEAQAILGEEVEVAAAFQNISYENLLTDESVECDVLVVGKTRQARETALELVRAAGLIGWDAGPLENAVVVEGLTSILIGINKQHGIHSAGIRITGVPGKQ